MAYLTNLLLPITYIHIFLYETNRNRIVNHYGGHTRQLSRHFEIKREISKQWSGLGRELFTDADYFSVTFPLNLDVRMKALVFAALFLIVSISVKIRNRETQYRTQ